MLYESKVVANYRLCRVLQVIRAQDGSVCTVQVCYLPRRSLRRVAYVPVPLEAKEVAVQRLVPVVLIEEQD